MKKTRENVKAFVPYDKRKLNTVNESRTKKQNEKLNVRAKENKNGNS